MFVRSQIPLLFVLKIGSLDPATHAYSFWEGVPVDAKYAFGCLFAASKTLQVTLATQTNKLACHQSINGLSQ